MQDGPSELGREQILLEPACTCEEPLVVLFEQRFRVLIGQ